MPTVSKRTTAVRASKPKKPRPDFPLFPHARGYWAKKVRGALVYFGKIVDDPKGVNALEHWLNQRDDLLAGRTPRTDANGLVLRELADRFLIAKEQKLNAGEIVRSTWQDYHETSKNLLAQFGPMRLVDDLAADDFEGLRAALAKRLGPVALGNEINRIKILFRYGYEAGLLDRPVRYGPEFRRPSKKVLRRVRHARGLRMFSAAEIRAMLAKADTQINAMILLGINCGLGNNDVGLLPRSALDLRGGWLNYPRPKTGIARRCALWPETVKALRAVAKIRPKPKSADDAGLVFITKYGSCWSKETSDNPVSKEVAKLLTSLKIDRKGLNFYALRHTFATIGGESRDQVAVNAIMGHADPTMAGEYRETISDERLKAVSDLVRTWLYAAPAKRSKS